MASIYSYSFIVLLSTLLLGENVAGIPIPLVTHMNGVTSVMVTEHNTLNTTRDLSILDSPPLRFAMLHGAPAQQTSPAIQRRQSGSNGLIGTLQGFFGSRRSAPQEPLVGGNPNAGTILPDPLLRRGYETTTTVHPVTVVTVTPSTPCTTLGRSTAPGTIVDPVSPSAEPTPLPAPTTSTPPPPPPPAPTPSSIMDISTSLPVPPKSSPSASSSTPCPTSTSMASAPPRPSTPTTSCSCEISESSPSASPSTPTTSSSSVVETTAPAPSLTTRTSTTRTPSPTSPTAAPPAPTGGSPPSTGVNTFKLSLVNNLKTSNVNAYITGLDKNGDVVMLASDGSFYYPKSPGSSTPVPIDANIGLPLNGPGELTEFTIPDYILSSRVWFAADGTLGFSVVDTEFGPGLVEPSSVNPDDPSANVDWGFIELTFKNNYGLFANLSFVDFVGLPLAMELQGYRTSSIQSVGGLPEGAVEETCRRLKEQAARDGQPWDELCVQDSEGNVIRIAAPSNLMNTNGNAFDGYFDNYVDRAWRRFESEPLIINTQNDNGEVQCTSDGNTITCEGDNRGYSKPTAADIFGCNTGPFAIREDDNDIHKAVVPRLCAAINRGTLLLPEGNVQPKLPPSSYYQNRVNNWYSAIVHEVEVDGRGYAFSYDDVAPTQGDDTSGSAYAPDPEVLRVFIGGRTD